MHSSLVTRSALAIAIGVSLIATLHAKGPTIKLTITGPTLSAPLDVTEASLLETSNVYAGAFLGPVGAPPAPALPRYHVAFHVVPPPWMKQPVQVKYVLIYAKDPVSGAGFIYLPGRGDDGYRVNIRTIIRDRQDGQWMSASPLWARALNKLLPPF